MTKEKTKPLRRSKIFTPEQNARLNKLEIIKDEEEATKEEQPNFGLGLKKRTMDTRSNSNETKQKEHSHQYHHHGV